LEVAAHTPAAVAKFLDASGRAAKAIPAAADCGNNQHLSPTRHEAHADITRPVRAVAR